MNIFFDDQEFMTGITTALFAGSTCKRANQKSPVADKKLKVFIIEVVKF